MTCSIQVEACSHSHHDQEEVTAAPTSDAAIRVEFISEGKVVGNETKYGEPDCITHQTAAAAVWEADVEKIPNAIAIRTNSTNGFHFDHFVFSCNGLVLKHVEAADAFRGGGGWCVSKEGAWRFHRGELKKAAPGADGSPDSSCRNGIIVSLSDGNWQPSYGIG